MGQGRKNGGRWSWFECGEGANDDAVGAAVGDVAIGDEDQEEGRCREFGGGEFGGKGGKRAPPFVNEGGTAHFDFVRMVGDVLGGELAEEQPKKSVTEMLVSFPSWGRT